MVNTALAPTRVEPGDDAEVSSEVDAARLRGLFAAHYQFIWRQLRRLGVPEHAVEDASQEVFLIAARKIGPVAKQRERAFLFQVVLRVASDSRRFSRRHPDVAGAQEFPDLVDPLPTPEELIDLQVARSALDRIVAELPLDVRAIFVLFELEGMSGREIADLLELSPGTVASRLRRSRDMFETAVRRYRTRAERGRQP